MDQETYPGTQLASELSGYSHFPWSLALLICVKLNITCNGLNMGKQTMAVTAAVTGPGPTRPTAVKATALVCRKPGMPETQRQTSKTPVSMDNSNRMRGKQTNESNGNQFAEEGDLEGAIDGAANVRRATTLVGSTSNALLSDGENGEGQKSEETHLGCCCDGPQGLGEGRSSVLGLQVKALYHD